MDETTEKPEGFHITDESSAVWLLRKLRGLEEEQDAIKAATAQRIEELTADKNRLIGRFGAELEAWARQEAEARRRKTITVPLAGCSVAFRANPSRLETTEEAGEIAITLGFTKAPAPDLTAYRKHAQAHLEATGELLPGLVMTEARESFGIRFPKSKGGSEEPPTD